MDFFVKEFREGPLHIVYEHEHRYHLWISALAGPEQTPQKQTHSSSVTTKCTENQPCYM